MNPAESTKSAGFRGGLHVPAVTIYVARDLHYDTPGRQHLQRIPEISFTAQEISP
jgi:hypothetical protein